MVPSTNTTVEADFQIAAPKDVTIHGERLWLTNKFDDARSMDRMNSEIEEASKYLATAAVDVIAYGCTTGSFYKGRGWDKEMLRLIEKAAKVPAVGTSPAVVAALRAFKAKKISVATPYPDWNNGKLRDYLVSEGFTVLNLKGDPRGAHSGNQEINDLEPEGIIEFSSKLCRDDADALFCACTAWRAMETAEELERITGKTVITSNQATFWAALSKAGIDAPVHGYGKLLEMPGRTKMKVLAV